MDSFASTFEKVIAETTNLTKEEINDSRDLYNILSMPQGGLTLKQGHHMMALLGYRDCDFNMDEELLNFENILEMTAKKKEAINGIEAEYQQVFRLMDIRNTGYASVDDLHKYLAEVDVPMKDKDTEHLTEMISNSFPDKFSESDFVHYMVSYTSLQQALAQKEEQLKKQNKANGKGKKEPPKK